MYTGSASGSGPVIWLSPDPYYSYLSFDITSCAGALVGFSSDMGNMQNGYEALIGYNDNSQTVLREIKNGQSSTLVSKETPGALQCNKVKDYWINFKHPLKTLEVGSGKPLGGAFINTTIEDNAFMPVRAVTFSSTNNHQAWWDVERRQCEYDLQKANNCWQHCLIVLLH